MTDPLEIHNGPNKYDLMMSLFERRKIVFMFNHSNMKVVVNSLARPSDNITIEYSRRFRDVQATRDGDLWIFHGTVVRTPGFEMPLLDVAGEKQETAMDGQVVGIYSDRKRRGFAALDQKRLTSKDRGFQAYLTKALDQIADAWSDPRLY